MRVERFSLFFPPHSGKVAGGGDRVRDRRDPARRLREDQRDEPARGASRGGRAARLPQPAGAEAYRGDRARAPRATSWSRSSRLFLFAPRVVGPARPRQSRRRRRLPRLRSAASRRPASSRSTAGSGARTKLREAISRPPLSRRQVDGCASGQRRWLTVGATQRRESIVRARPRYDAGEGRRPQYWLRASGTTTARYSSAGGCRAASSPDVVRDDEDRAS